MHCGKECFRMLSILLMFQLLQNDEGAGKCKCCSVLLDVDYVVDAASFAAC